MVCPARRLGVFLLADFTWNTVEYRLATFPAHSLES